MTILGPQKIFDSSLAHIAYLWSRNSSNGQKLHEQVFERFWRRELDLESLESLISLMRETNVEVKGFEEYLKEEGRDLHNKIQKEAEAKGVFGVPSWLVDGELFWGLERLERLREKIL